MITQRNCPVCAGNEAELLHEHEFVLFEGHPLSGRCLTVFCRDCGCGFSAQTPSSEAYLAHYTELSKYATAFSPLAGADKFSQLAEALSRLCPSRDTAILDAGCGGGGFLAKLQELGYTRLSAMDANPACVAGVRRELKIEALAGTLAEPPFQPGRFDLVISTGVLEHLLHPIEDLTGLRRLLAPGGAAFIAVPDASRYAEFLDAPFQDFNVEHINHFSPGTLRTFFSRRGWRERASERMALAKTVTWNEPIVYGLFEPLSSGNSGGAFDFDTELADNLRAYVQLSSVKLAEIDQRLRRELAGESEVILWGAGQTASLLLGQSMLKEMNIRAVVDSNPVYSGHRLAGAPVGGPEIAGDFAGPVVVCTIREGKAVEKMIHETLRWGSRVITLE